MMRAAQARRPETPAGGAKLREAATLWEGAQKKFETVFGAKKSKELREALAFVASDEFASAFRGAKVRG